MSAPLQPSAQKATPHIGSAAQVHAALPLPLPPLCSSHPDNTIHIGDIALITLQDGNKISHPILAVNLDKGKIAVKIPQQNEPKIIDASVIKMIVFPKPCRWMNSSGKQGGEGVTVESEERFRPFEIQFKDGDRLKGKTFGFNTTRYGIFLFPVAGEEQFRYAFIAHDVIKSQQIGPRLGELLVQDQVVDAYALSMSLDHQQGDRKVPLGEYLLNTAVVTTKELEKVLQRQRANPNLKLGDILIHEGLVDKEQLELALKAQKKDRQMPLGQALVKNGLVTSTQIQRTLAKKLGIPFVDLETIKISQQAVDLVGKEVAEKYQIVPVHIYDGKLIIATEDPMNWESLDILREHTGLQVEPAMSSAEEIKATLARLYESELTTISVPEKKPRSPLTYDGATGETLTLETVDVDAPPPSESRTQQSLDGHKEKSLIAKTPLNLPLPPLSVSHEDNVFYVGDNVMISLQSGTRVNGSILAINLEKGKIAIKPKGKKDATLVDIEKIKMMLFPKVCRWVRKTFKEGEEALVTDTEQPTRDFEVKFKDHDSLRGMTLGFSTNRFGIFLYPLVSQDNHEQYRCVLIAHQAIERHRIGKPIGELLVEDKVVDKEELDSNLNNQESDRQQPLGEYLLSSAVVTAKDLEKVLQRQKSAPNLRLGEILISENLITEEQLQMALSAQKSNRKIPLGQMLVKNGVVTSAQIQRSLAKKLGIPFVDLDTFEFNDDAIQIVGEEIARKYTIVPVHIYENKLVIAIENPMNWEALDALRFHTKLQVEPAMASHEDILRTLDKIFRKAGSSNDYAIELAEIETIDVSYEEDEVTTDYSDNSAINDNTVVKMVNKIILDAYQQNASDIHIEPGIGKEKTTVRIRKDGSLVNYHEFPSGRVSQGLTSRIKVMSGLDISERRKPQDGKIAFKYKELKIELRVATIPTAGNQEDVVMRILAAGKPIPLDKLGLNPYNRKVLTDIITKPYGLILVCGPTGSGKTTTLHSVLSHLNTEDRKIWTAEDPVEIVQKGLRQVQVNSKINFTFAAAMRAFLRADPDIIMVGEMRDQETTKTGVEASLTGHLVLSTLHTNSAPESVTRLLDLGIDPFSFSDALLGILAQRLTKRLCEGCKQPYECDEKELRTLATEYAAELDSTYQSREGIDLILEQWRRRFAKADQFILYRAKGCPKCEDTGYKGRVGIHELLEASESVKKLITTHATIQELTKEAIQQGMRTLKQDGIEKVLMGFTDIQQVHRVCIK